MTKQTTIVVTGSLRVKLYQEYSEPANIKRERDITIMTLSIGLVGLAYNYPANTIKVMSGRSVYLITLLLGRLSPQAKTN